MPITRQDIKKISAELAKSSKKDTDFTEVTSLDKNSSVTAVKDGKNCRINATNLVRYVCNALSLKDIHVDINNYQGNLFNLLQEIAAGHNSGDQLWATNITFNGANIITIDPNANIKNVQNAIDRLFNIIYGLQDYAFPTAAQYVDIDPMFTSSDN